LNVIKRELLSYLGTEAVGG